MRIKRIIGQYKEKKIVRYLRKSINRELLSSIFVCAVLSIILYLVTYNLFGSMDCFLEEHVSYDQSRIQENKQIFDFIDNIYAHQEDKDFFEYLQNEINGLEKTAYLTDEEGIVQYESDQNQTAAKQIDLAAWNDKVANHQQDELLTIRYPLVLNSKLYYLLCEIELRPVYIYTKEILYLVCGAVSLIFFLVQVLMIARDKITYVKYLGKAAKEMSEGNLNVDVDVRGLDELAVIAKNMNAMEENLTKRIEREHKQYEEQQELITNMSHDLKTPITVLLGYLDILRTHQYKEESDLNNYLDISYEKTVSLKNMVLKLFELSKAKKDEQLQLAEVNISRLLRQLVLEYEPIAEEHHLKLIMDIPKDKITVMLDLEKITAVLHNMMTNAMKYTTFNGTVSIQLQQAETEVKLIFTNPCPSMSEEELEDIFKKFYRADKARNSIVEGNGIGLALVKKTIELHGGTIFADYKQGNISFTIRLRR